MKYLFVLGILMLARCSKPEAAEDPNRIAFSMTDDELQKAALGDLYENLKITQPNFECEYRFKCDADWMARSYVRLGQIRAWAAGLADKRLSKAYLAWVDYYQSDLDKAAAGASLKAKIADLPRPPRK